MQREWAVYLLQRSCLPPGLSRGACPHHYFSSAPVPTLQLNILVKLHLAKKDSIKREKERKTESHSPPIALGHVLFYPRLELKMGETTQRLCLGTEENKQTPNTKEVLIKSQAALQLCCAASQNKKLFVVGLFTLPPSYSTCFLNLLRISPDFLFSLFRPPPPYFHLSVCEKRCVAEAKTWDMTAKQ